MLSVLICTYNRVELLSECLSTLASQSISNQQFEVLVIDNSSTDATAELVKKIQTENPNFRYILEKNIGLSYARNRGAKEAKFPWLLYLDDDILASQNVCEETITTFQNNNWAAFGGVYTQWFYYGKPKWFPETWNTNINDWNTYSELPQGKHATGCVFAIHKEKLFEVGGFSPIFGMSGNRIGYGEETDVQQKLRAKGYAIGFNPAILIKHIVPKHKLSIGWHLRAAWINQIAALNINPQQVEYPFLKTLYRIMVASIKRLRYVKNLFKKNYYWQNFVFDYSEPIIRLCASVYTLHINKK